MSGSMLGMIHDQKELHAQSHITTQNFQVKDFTWRCEVEGADICEGYAVTSTGDVYYSADINLQPFQQVILRNGEPLRGIKKISMQKNYIGEIVGEGQEKPVFALREDGTIYGKGDASWGGFGDGYISYPSYFEPVPTAFASPIKDIELGTTNAYFLLENGELYSSGSDDFGGRGAGEAVYDIDFSKVAVPQIKQIEANHNNAFALDTTGTVWVWGRFPFGFILGSNFNSNTPKKMMEGYNTDFRIPVLYLGDADVALDESSTGIGIVFMAEDKKIYYSHNCESVDNMLNIGSFASMPEEIINPYPEFTGNVSKLSFTLNNISLIDNNTYYAMVSSGMNDEFDSTSNIMDLREELHPYSSEATGVNASIPVFAAASNHRHTYIIKEDKKLFIDGKPAEFVVDLKIEASFGVENTEYTSGDKYNDKVALAFTVAAENQNAIRYKVAEHPDVIFGEEQVVVDANNFTIEAVEGEHLHRTYRMYLEGKENSTAQDITVDLYKKSFHDVSVADEESYAVDTILTFDETNGLEGNSVVATLTNPSGTEATISSGYTMSEEGSYHVNLKDDYGNQYDADFQIGASQGLTFTSLGELIFGNECTQQGARFGTISVHEEALTEASITDGDENGYFTIDIDAQRHTSYIKAIQAVPAGSYSLTISGKDAQGVEFDGLCISFTVAKANVALEWSEEVVNAEQNGLYFSDAFQASVANAPTGVTIGYELVEAVEGIRVDADGTFTYEDITQDTVTVKIKAALATGSNYEIDPITAEITIQKQALTLKTTIQNGNAYVDTYDIVFGSTPPAFRVEQTGSIMDTIPQPTSYQYVKGENQAVSEINEVGSYQIQPVYASLPDSFKLYTITWTYAQLQVQELSINDANAAQFYSLTLDDQNHTSYTEGSWTNKAIIIKQKHADYHRMSVNEGELSTTSYRFQESGVHEVALKFCNTNNECAQTSVSLKYDATPPVITGAVDNAEHVYYHHPRTITVQDVGSGIAESTLRNSNGTSTPIHEQVTLDAASGYIIDVKDEAGNESTIAFMMRALPNMDEIDGSDASYQIIEDMIADAGYYATDEIDRLEYSDWIADAKQKWQEQRVTSIIARDQNGKIESLYALGFDPALALVVEDVAVDTIPALPYPALQVFDVYLKKGNTNVSLAGNAKVYLPYTQAEEPIVYQIDKQSNEAVQIPAEKEGDYVTFTASSLMRYAISNTAQEIKETNVCVVGPDKKLHTKDDVCAKSNEKGEALVKKANGSVEVPKGGSILFPKDKNMKLPDGGILHSDGRVELPDGTKYDANGDKVKKPEEPSKDPNDDTAKDPSSDTSKNPSNDSTKDPDNSSITEEDNGNDTNQKEHSAGDVVGANTGTEDFTNHYVFLCLSLVSFISICIYRYERIK